MRYGLIVFWVLLCSVTSAAAQVSVGIGLPGVSIGINLLSYPELVPVPGYPVYYAPRLNSNFFFYDGSYWVYQGDSWYASSWYDGPWVLVAPEVVPLFVLRIPVRYYRAPPVYFRGWRSDAPPRWGEHWGNQWEQHRRGWDRWNRSSVPAPAPLPVYQRQYSGDRYPRVEQQQALHSQNYRYRPRDAVVRQLYQEQAVQRAPAPTQREIQGEPQQRGPKPQAIDRSTPPPPPQQGGPAVPRSQPPQGAAERVQRPAPPQQEGPAVQRQGKPPQGAAERFEGPAQGVPGVQRQGQQPPQGAAPREQQTPRSQGQEERPQGKGTSQEPGRAQKPGQEKDREKGEGRGQERNK
jgi:hypothetical protein